MVYKNPFIKLPKNIEKFNQQMQEVVDIMNEYHIEPIDFLHFMVRWYSPMRIFPQPCHLKAVKAINKYRYHQSLKNKYVFDDYSIDGDEFTIHETMEMVSYKNNIMLPPDKDIRLRGAMFLCTQKDYTLSDKDKRNIAYAYCKLKFIGRPVPEELLKLKEEAAK
jgi:hypothetical protein